MKFRSEILLQPNDSKINHRSSIFMIGSCFTSTIGQKFIQNKFSTVVNPYGTLYHPGAITANLKHALASQPYDEAHVIKLNNKFVHYLTHSKINAPDPLTLLKRLNETNVQVKNALCHANYIFITLGSAYFFTHIDLDLLVGNCHKQPNKAFKRNLSTVNSIRTELSELIEKIREINNSFEVIFTVSPVRHLRDGFTENSLSKAHLISAVHDVVASYHEASYFPSFEIVMDDLRDYRFYESDLIHPNDMAIEYIWAKFSDIYFSQKTIDLMRKINSLQKRISHRPFDIQDQNYQEMLASTKSELQELSSKEELDFREELDKIRDLMN